MRARVVESGVAATNAFIEGTKWVKRESIEDQKISVEVEGYEFKWITNDDKERSYVRLKNNPPATLWWSPRSRSATLCLHHLYSTTVEGLRKIIIVQKSYDCLRLNCEAIRTTNKIAANNDGKRSLRCQGRSSRTSDHVMLDKRNRFVDKIEFQREV